ncbi:MAG TPA: DUF488 domain-containing protein [Steroidobacteraceae bacterium]|nr:DUF488 domain-containing protein [Steroidobacteraceae bacterium]
MKKLPPPAQASWAAGTIFTLGHSTLPIEQFVALLQAYGIEQLADIRTVPRSRHNPQFNADALAHSLHAAHIAYESMPELGGLRRPLRDSPNAGWRNTSFRGYADYMQTVEFQNAVDALVRMGRAKRSAIMCAESVPWRCHRSLVADALEVRGVAVVEIMTQSNYRMHALTPFAHVDGLTITYPPEQPDLL